MNMTNVQENCKRLRAILIDPVVREVREVEYDGNYRSIYKLIDASTFETVGLGGPNEETVFVDEEFLFAAEAAGEEGSPFFYLAGFPSPLGGKGLILGTNDEGESIATQLTVDQVRKIIRFAHLKMVGWTDGSEGYVDHPIMGKVWMIKGPEPIFETIDVEDAA